MVGYFVGKVVMLALMTAVSLAIILAAGLLFVPELLEAGITALAGWVQAIAQVFPIYWLGQGMRAALLPDAAVAAEIGQSWRYLEMFGVLGAWAVAGLLLAPAILRRMARRESGANMEQRRQAALQRMG